MNISIDFCLQCKFVKKKGNKFFCTVTGKELGNLVNCPFAEYDEETDRIYVSLPSGEIITMGKEK